MSVWQDEIDVRVSAPSPQPSSPMKRPLNSEESPSQFTTPRSSPALGVGSSRNNSFTHPPNSTPDTLLGSPLKKARVESSVHYNGDLHTPSSSMLSRTSHAESNPFIDHNNTSLPPSSIFATPSSTPSASQSASPSKNISAEDFRSQGHSFIDAITRQMTKLESRERAAKQQSDRFKLLYENEKSKTAELTQRVAELEKRNSELELSLASLDLPSDL